MGYRPARSEYVTPYYFDNTAMKQSWLVLRSSSGCGLGSGIGASVLSFVVGQTFFNSCFKWPFVVAGKSGRCL